MAEITTKTKTNIVRAFGRVPIDFRFEKDRNILPFKVPFTIKARKIIEKGKARFINE